MIVLQKNREGYLMLISLKSFTLEFHMQPDLLIFTSDANSILLYKMCKF